MRPSSCLNARSLKRMQKKKNKTWLHMKNRFYLFTLTTCHRINLNKQLSYLPIDKVILKRNVDVSTFSFNITKFWNCSFSLQLTVYTLHVFSFFCFDGINLFFIYCFYSPLATFVFISYKVQELGGRPTIVEPLSGIPNLLFYFCFTQLFAVCW